MINKFQKEVISFINDVDSLKEWNISSEGKNLKITYVFGITIMSILLLWRHWKFRDSTIENIFAEKRQLTVGLLWIGMIITIIYIRGGGGNAFIYFQF